MTWLWLRPCDQAVPGLSCPSLCNDRSRAWFVAEPGFIIKSQSTEAFGRIVFPGFARAVRTLKMVHYSSPTMYLAAFPWCLGVACGIQIMDSSGDDLVFWRNAWLDSGFLVCDSTWLLDELHTFSTSTRTWILSFFLHSHAEWRSMLSRCFDLSPCTRCSPLEYGHYFYESMCWNRLDDEGIFRAQCAFFGLTR